jgi:hypothetical protein
VSLRFTPEHLALIDEDRNRPGRGWTRQEWFDRLTVRYLQGAGLLTAAATAPPEGLPRVGPPTAGHGVAVTGAAREVEPMFKPTAPSRVRR